MMRWNPRRRQVTSVVYVRSRNHIEPKRPEEVKSPWNSLEVAKIFVGVLTPLCVLAFGTYVSLQSRSDDVRRMAADELRARKAAALPVIYDLDTQYHSFARIASDAVHMAHAAKSVSPDKPQLAREQAERLFAASDDYSKHFQEDWLKLRTMLNDESQYENLHQDSLDTVFLPVTQTARDCMYAIPSEKGMALPKKCDALLIKNRATNCEFLVNFRLERFDTPESGELMEQSRKVFCPGARLPAGE